MLLKVIEFWVQLFLLIKVEKKSMKYSNTLEKLAKHSMVPPSECVQIIYKEIAT